MASDPTSSWWQNLGDNIGVPAALSSAPALKALAARLGSYGAGALGGMAAAPFTAGGSFLAGMGDGRGNATTATGPEMDLYVRDPATGQMIPNPQLHGINPMQGGMNTLPPAAPQGAQAAAAPVAASPSPSPLPPGLALGPQSLGPLGAPLLHGSTGGWGSPQTAPQAQPQAPQGQPAMAPPATGGTTQPPPNFYNGPGSMDFGQGGAAGLGQGAPWRNPDMNQPRGPGYGGQHQGLIGRMVQTLGNAFHSNGGMTPGWFGSDKWYNN